MFEFKWPYLLFLMLLPTLTWMLPAVRSHSLSTVHVPFFQNLWSNLSVTFDKTPLLLKLIALIAWALLIIAAARPVWVDDPVALPIEGRDLMIAVDVSASMQEIDLKINGQSVDRLTAIKHVAGEFIERRKGDRIGLILFGQQAYLQAPLSFDRVTVKQLLDESFIGIAGKATAIGDAIGLAVKKVRETSDNNRILILLTDGQNTAGEINPVKAADLASQEGLKVYTIGIGADEIYKQTVFGTRLVNPSTDLDEVTLKKIAQLTNGQYFRARNTKELEDIYTMLDELEPLAKEDEFYRPTTELFLWPLIFSMLSLITAMLLRRF